MNIRSETVRKYVLDNLERGEFAVGMRLPGSRKIAEILGVSRPVVQSALDTLVNEGLLRAVSRSGLYVDESWTGRRICNCLKVYTTDEYLPWMALLRQEISGKLPELHISNRCEEGTFEIVTTAVAQTRWREFADLMPILKKCYPDLSAFQLQQLKPFMHDGRLTALPFLFSPRLIACNRKMLQEAGCPEPEPEWTWKDFSQLVQKLAGYFPAEKVFPWNNSYYCWMNFILSSGGSLFCQGKADPVCFDSPEAIEALKLFRFLRSQKYPSSFESISEYDKFALSIIDRQIYGLNREKLEQGFLFLPMPGITPAHTGKSIQATELLVMRRGCVDHGLCLPLIRFLWSEKFQDHLAELRCGIPLRYSSLEKTFSADSSIDAAFENALERLSSEYHLSSPDIFHLISTGLSLILAGDDDLESQVKELAFVVRKYLKYTQKDQ